MTKKDFIALAKLISSHDNGAENAERFTAKQIAKLADFCAAQNPQFNRSRWLDYVSGKCGVNGGPVKS